MTTSAALADIPLTDDDSLTRRWSDILTGGRRAQEAQLWLGWIHPDGRMPFTIPVLDEVSPRVDRRTMHLVFLMHVELARMQGVPDGLLHLALVLRRPGASRSTVDDEGWRAAVDQVLRHRYRLGCSLHVTDGRRVTELLPRRRWPTRASAAGGAARRP